MIELENIIGDLRSYTQLEDDTFQHVDELTNQRRDGPNLCGKSFYTADGAIYFMRNSNPMLAITRGLHNPVLNFISSASTQLIQKSNFYVVREIAKAAVNAEDTEVFDLTKLNLSKRKFSGTGVRFLEVTTSPDDGYEMVNSEERRLVERVYGKGDDFVQNMELLADMGIERIEIYVLGPDYVRRNAANGPLARTSWLGSFGSLSKTVDFGAVGCDVDDLLYLRGLRLDRITDYIVVKSDVDSRVKKIYFNTLKEQKA